MGITHFYMIYVLMSIVLYDFEKPDAIVPNTDYPITTVSTQIGHDNVCTKAKQLQMLVSEGSCFGF